MFTFALGQKPVGRMVSYYHWLCANNGFGIIRQDKGLACRLEFRRRCALQSPTVQG